VKCQQTAESRKDERILRAIFLPPLAGLGVFCPANPRLKLWAIFGCVFGTVENICRTFQMAQFVSAEFDGDFLETKGVNEFKTLASSATNLITIIL
jgi:hypothetical protein